MSDGTICESCLPTLVALRDENAGLQETIRRQAGALGKLRRESDEGMREHALWDRGHRLFKVWGRATGHTNSKFTVKRFRQALPFLEIHEDDVIGRGIEGIAFDPWIRRNRNGLEERVDGWGDLFKDDETFERYCNKAPLNWKENLIDHAAEVGARS